MDTNINTKSMYKVKDISLASWADGRFYVRPSGPRVGLRVASDLKCRDRPLCHRLARLPRPIDDGPVEVSTNAGIKHTLFLSHG